MYYVTYRFNDEIILTVLVMSVSIFKDLENSDTILQFTDRKAVTHRLPGDTLISILPYQRKRKH